MPAFTSPAQRREGDRRPRPKAGEPRVEGASRAHCRTLAPSTTPVRCRNGDGRAWFGGGTYFGGVAGAVAGRMPVASRRAFASAWLCSGKPPSSMAEARKNP